MINSLNKMTNEEIIGLAKNRFLPPELQLAIAKHPYKRANLYLASNRLLDQRAKDYMWSDKCNAGYVLKAEMVGYGLYADSPEKYRELFNRYPRLWTNSPWRLIFAFLSNARAGNHFGAPHTPPDLLEDIYSSYLNPKNEAITDARGHSYTHTHCLGLLSTHPNCSLKLAIQLSTCGLPKIERSAFNKIVELS